MKKYLAALILPILLAGCGAQSVSPKETNQQATQNQPATSNVQQADTKASQPLQSQPQTTNIQTTPTAKAKSTAATNSSNTKSVTISSSPTQSSNSATKTTSTTTNSTIQRTPTILAQSNPNASFSDIKGTGFNIMSPLDKTNVPINNFTIKWDNGFAPNFVLRVIDLSTNETVVFWSYIGAVKSYTIPSSVVKVGHQYEVDLEAASGTNYQQPGYQTLKPNNLGAGEIGFFYTIIN